MSHATHLLAIDLGAESGRGILGSFDGDRISFEVLHRFSNGGVRIGDRLYWDVLKLFGDIKTSMTKGSQHVKLSSVGVDTWGVDFALLGENVELLGNPRHYRDVHTEPIMAQAFAIVPPEKIFAQTGIQFMRFNTLFQLLALKHARSSLLGAAQKLVFMPDLFHCWLCGNTANELTIASTSQCYDPVHQRWAKSLLDGLGLPAHLFQNIVPTGTRLGPLLPGLAQELGLRSIPVIAPAGHDTAAAVAAVPAQGEDWCYLSSGTWSLMGVELTAPVINEQVRSANFTNEVGVGQTIRFLKNIMGLWLVQECRRSLARQGSDLEYDELVRLAGLTMPFASIVNPDDSSFLLPNDMPVALADYCRKSNQTIPDSPGAFVRCCLESLALRYRWTIEMLEQLTGRQIKTVHIVGGGSQNKLLNQLTADATGRLVLAGPVEATALGNLLTQAMGLGLVGSLYQLRDIVRRSFTPERFEPQHPSRWDEPYARFKTLLA